MPRVLASYCHIRHETGRLRAMTAKQLIEELQKVPPEAEVEYTNMEIPQTEPVHTVTLKENKFALPQYRWKVVLR